MDQAKKLEKLLEQISRGELSPQQGLEQLRYFDFEPVGDFAKIDHHRQLRTGFPEVVWGPGKTTGQIKAIVQSMLKKSALVMVTRIGPEVANELQEEITGLVYYPQARICTFRDEHRATKQAGLISVISAGTADLPVAEEAALTAELCGFQVERLWDVGVAGIHRLLSHQRTLATADVLIVVAGMEGALPSVVAGMVDCPVIAVPTSIGYGTSFGGLAPLLTMLNSCAAGVAVVNIDNGFGSAILAGQILRTATRISLNLDRENAH
jgi:pyridinium-3,5-biscarboxylic acid mononucleotide synthase